MKNREDIIRYLRELELEDPDPVWRTADVGDLLEASAPDHSFWDALISEFRGSTARAVVAGLAVGLIRDAERERPEASLEQILHLAMGLDMPYPNPVQLCLEAIRKQLRRRSFLGGSASLNSRESLAMREVALRCMSYSPWRSDVVVKMSLWDLFTELADEGLLDEVIQPVDETMFREYLEEVVAELGEPYDEFIEKHLFS